MDGTIALAWGERKRVCRTRMEEAWHNWTRDTASRLANRTCVFHIRRGGTGPYSSADRGLTDHRPPHGSMLTDVGTELKTGLDGSAFQKTARRASRRTQSC